MGLELFNNRLSFFKFQTDDGFEMLNYINIYLESVKSKTSRSDCILPAPPGTLYTF